MAYRVKKVKYCYVKVPSRAGQGAKILAALKDAGVNLLAFSGFPLKGGVSQVDLVSNEIPLIRRVARQQGWRLSAVKKAFLITGNDEVGVVERIVSRLAAGKIKITATDAVAAGAGRFGMILWVKPDKYNAAARLLGAH